MDLDGVKLFSEELPLCGRERNHAWIRSWLSREFGLRGEQARR